MSTALIQQDREPLVEEGVQLDFYRWAECQHVVAVDLSIAEAVLIRQHFNGFIAQINRDGETEILNHVAGQVHTVMGEDDYCFLVVPMLDADVDILVSWGRQLFRPVGFVQRWDKL